MLYEKTGYLAENFRLFHLIDQKEIAVDFHYHDFYKVLILLRGSLSYCIEGRTYDLQPNDIVFVNAGEVHRPIFHDNQPYERIIIYISKEFFSRYQQPENDLSLCFKTALEKQSHVLRIPGLFSSRLGQSLKELEVSGHNDLYAKELYHDILFIEFMIQLNRTVLQDQTQYIHNTASNKKMLALIDYLNEHLTEDLSIDQLAESFYMSRYHLMHAFKEETGYSIGNYISTKRLQLAKEYMQSGMNITQACYACGFRSYSAFSRAYKKHFLSCPSEELINVQKAYSLEVE